MKPFSDNVVFWDSEFSSLNPNEGEILALACVDVAGKELYLELEHEGECDPWVTEHVMPTLTGPKVSREEAVEKLFAYLGDRHPYLVAYVNQYDVAYLYKLLGVTTGMTTRHFPFQWIHIDFASMMFALGMSPEALSRSHPQDLAKELGLDMSQYPSHTALGDAKLLRDVYLALTKR